MKACILSVLLSALVAPTIVSAACGQCEDAHSCIGESVFQLCYDGVRDQTINYTCPESKPICTTYGIICMPNDTNVDRGCGDVSNCGVCSDTTTFACTSRTTFAICDNGVVSGNSFDCADDFVCSVSGAGSGSPCVSRCDSTDSDICDRVLEAEGESTTESVTTTDTPTATPTSTPTVTATTEPSTVTADSSTGSTGDTSTGSSSETSSDIPTDSTATVTVSESTTQSTATTPAFNEVTYCQGINSTGRYPIPNDTECTSYIYCVLRSGSWTGLLYNCQAQRPYFDADTLNCGTVQPLYAGCTNLA
ncbi:protein psiD [Drosophila erecta]|uniref:Chitin-binding type-2 domain-containing protein n=1 Tax=Drosophila erecta TaxID=7220 RepID=B3NBN0_DROER|nr:protein psiD [Drosophila erecta]EDV50626.2 uncharacterized protein Dere_GG14349 [Drosophila erecta]